MPGLNDHLYLLEVLVDNVSVASNDDPDIAVQVQFGDIGTFVIRRTTANSSDPADVDIADGKCLLFSMRPAQLVSYMEQHPLKLTVLKMSTGNSIIHQLYFFSNIRNIDWLIYKFKFCRRNAMHREIPLG